MLTYISADYIFPISSSPLKRGVIAYSGNEIMGVYPADHPTIVDKPIKRYSGIIVPGFVNAHCHLELSHLLGVIPKETGLIAFIENVIGQRGKYTAEDCQEAMLRADKQMYDNGIVAVGDISNTSSSIAVKNRSRLYYHTFIEVMGFNPESAQAIFNAGKELAKDFFPLKTSIVPHAPYSVSRELFRLIGKNSGVKRSILSIHNQESEEENKLYRYRNGEFIDFYNRMNINIDFFKAQARNSVQTYIHHFPEESPVLLVHNTYTKVKDVYFVKRSGRNVFFCFCPNANLYIEGRLPEVSSFLRTGFDFVIGTDSLASNDKLCVFSEVKTLLHHCPELTLEETLCWATLNGARVLGIDNKYGSIEPGKRPGLNLITDTFMHSLTEQSAIVRLL